MTGLRARSALAALLSLTLGGCPPPEPPPDGGSAPPSVELGEGQSTFRPIEDGDTLLVALGCQGSQHVWITLRSRNMAIRGTAIRLWLEDAAGVQVSLEFSVRLSFRASADGSYGELDALTLQIPEPDAVTGRPLTLHVELRDRDGLTASASREVTVAWGTERCMAVDAGPRDAGDGSVDAADPGDAGAPEDAGDVATLDAGI